MQVNFSLEEKERLSMWRFPDQTDEYIIGVDTSEGIDGGDYSCAQVIARSNFEQVAVWHGMIEPVDFGRTLFLLGNYYNTALLAVERKDPSGATVLDYLRGVSYPNLYKMQQFDYEVMQPTERLGWITSAHTRGLLLDTLRDVVKANQLIVHDPETVAEMKTFIRDKKSGKLKAAPGSHDDRIMSLAIATYLHTIMPRYGNNGYAGTMEAKLSKWESENGSEPVKLGRGGY